MNYRICGFALRRSIGVANFNVDHLKHLKEAQPDHIPAGIVLLSKYNLCQNHFVVYNK